MQNILFTLAAGGKIPNKSYPGDAGWDLFTLGERIVEPFSAADIPTGVKFALPNGYWAQIIARSSTFRKHRLQVVEAVIDNGYRGELYIQALNPLNVPVIIPDGSRIAQVILHKIYPAMWSRVEQLPPTERGERGFGSSGT